MWRYQSTASRRYRLEAAIAGLRGPNPSLAQAQRIALTRLARATVVITMIDLANGATVVGEMPPRGLRGGRRVRALAHVRNGQWPVVKLRAGAGSATERVVQLG